jgi:hypothetical protein
MRYLAGVSVSLALLAPAAEAAKLPKPISMVQHDKSKVRVHAMVERRGKEAGPTWGREVRGPGKAQPVKIHVFVRGY